MRRGGKSTGCTLDVRCWTVWGLSQDVGVSLKPGSQPTGKMWATENPTRGRVGVFSPNTKQSSPRIFIKPTSFFPALWWGTGPDRCVGGTLRVLESVETGRSRWIRPGCRVRSLWSSTPKVVGSCPPSRPRCLVTRGSTKGDVFKTLDSI